ncbi:MULTISPECIES: cytochrome b/b6 domain-containing protein [Thiorhodovibrio]|uniref:cytochrome b/b6 domain-containing protein n=1 Tax=Thiorhodovibrio TaxID=61593 RepID=UPI001912335C|nr:MULTISPECIES: cytochrome b/b6 domain-containing protein [Thiorhodovibrio]MBK5967871.1 cytochrome b [Thiorhodovibrio winogradskyi]WPL14097.1 thiosulfate reductase cytochrome b subunit [Thiorhodovibrio litoralis]
MSALYLYPVWLRLWHWLNALLFIVLMVTGASMHFAGMPWLLPFDTAVPIHNATGILLTISWVVFVLGNLFTTNGRHYRVRFRGLFKRLFAQMTYYGYGIFHNAPHPFHVTEEEKLNTLQQLSYIGVMYALMPLLIISGWSFLYSVYLPETLFGIGTLWIIAMAHLTLAYFLVLFLIVHMYIITTGETILTNLRAMFTGWHRETDH